MLTCPPANAATGDHQPRTLQLAVGLAVSIHVERAPMLQVEAEQGTGRLRKGLCFAWADCKGGRRGEENGKSTLLKIVGIGMIATRSRIEP